MANTRGSRGRSALAALVLCLGGALSGGAAAVPVAPFVSIQPGAAQVDPASMELVRNAARVTGGGVAVLTFGETFAPRVWQAVVERGLAVRRMLDRSAPAWLTVQMGAMARLNPTELESIPQPIVAQLFRNETFRPIQLLCNAADPRGVRHAAAYAAAAAKLGEPGAEAPGNKINVGASMVDAGPALRGTGADLLDSADAGAGGGAPGTGTGSGAGGTGTGTASNGGPGTGANSESLWGTQGTAAASASASSSSSSDQQRSSASLSYRDSALLYASNSGGSATGSTTSVIALLPAAQSPAPAQAATPTTGDSGAAIVPAAIVPATIVPTGDSTPAADTAPAAAPQPVATVDPLPPGVAVPAPSFAIPTDSSAQTATVPAASTPVASNDSGKGTSSGTPAVSDTPKTTTPTASKPATSTGTPSPEPTQTVVLGPQQAVAVAAAPVPVPEPGALPLVGAGLVLCLLARRRASRAG